MIDENFLIINEAFDSFYVSPYEMDFLLAEAWRNFGKVIPLRIRLRDFTLSKSQRRNLQRNQDLRIVIQPISITKEKTKLFDRHKQRFEEYPPESVYTFISAEPATIPSEAFEICVFEDKKLLAVSFFNVGEDSLSGIYAMFEPSETTRGLGILTMLLEIKYAQKLGKSYYYQGYAYQGESFYDYKKRFRSLEMYDWEGNHWLDFKE
jgi:leucyl-tRNA---protein transferase